MYEDLSVVILAAGAGSRLNQSVPKPWVCVAGKPALQWIWDVCARLGCADVITVIHPSQADFFNEVAPNYRGRWAYQEQRQGTADAAYTGMQGARHERVLILNGDTPLLSEAMLQGLLRYDQALLGFTAQTSGYGSVVLSDGYAERIEEGSVGAVANAGVYILSRTWAMTHIPLIQPQGSKQEIWLTEVVAMAATEGRPFHVHLVEESWRCEGINTVPQWVALEARWRQAVTEYWMNQGVYLEAPESIGWSPDMNIGYGVHIGRGCVFEGEVILGEDVHIEAYCIIRNAVIGAGSRIYAYTYVEDAVLGTHTRLGPYAHIQKSECAHNVEIGNYVEIKRSHLGPYTKAKHLAYIGDTTTGRCVNIGAGAVVCNYDGVKKSKTSLGEGVFVGGNVTIIAPAVVGAYAVLAAGSVIVSDVPESKLAYARSSMQIREHRLCSVVKERVRVLDAQGALGR